MWDLIVSVPEHCLSFYFAGSWMRERTWSIDRFALRFDSDLVSLEDADGAHDQKLWRN